MTAHLVMEEGSSSSHEVRLVKRPLSKQKMNAGRVMAPPKVAKSDGYTLMVLYVYQLHDERGNNKVYKSSASCYGKTELGDILLL